jgi:hypothetical protein
MFSGLVMGFSGGSSGRGSHTGQRMDRFPPLAIRKGSDLDRAEFFHKILFLLKLSFWFLLARSPFSPV